MYKAFGIVNSSGRNIYVDGMQDYRPIGAFSFLGRYRVIDFPISNMTNSNIDCIQVYINNKPRSVVEHGGTGRHYNSNSKSGKLQLLFSEHNNDNDIYNTDISCYLENMESLSRMSHPYVVIAPSYMVYSIDFDQFIHTHIDSGADVTLLYHSVDNAKEAYLTCNVLNLNRQKGVEAIGPNHGNKKNQNIYMDTCVMKTELFISLVREAKKLSSMYTLADILNDKCETLDIRGVAHKGFFASITDFPSYYAANMDLLDYKAAQELFHENWPIYTRTNDSCPTQYFDTAEVKNSVISNGCQIEGTVENSVIGRGCVIKKGAVVRNSVVLAEVTVGEDVHVENEVVDKWAKLIHKKEIISPADQPGYIKRNDTL